MRALLSVGGTDIPDPSTYDATTSTIVDKGRNAQGRLIASVIRDDVAKVEVSWRYLSVADWARILTMFKGADKFVRNVTFLNQSSGQYETRSMYISDRKAGVFKRDPVTGEVVGWLGCGFSLVEV